MMNNEYVYLRNTTPSTNTRSISPASTEAVIETAELSKQDISDLHRDPSILASTPNMPTALIEPLPSSEYAEIEVDKDFLNALENQLEPEINQNTDEYTWGIKAVRADQSGYTGKGAVIAILDTGIDSSHERFTGVNLTLKNFSKGSDNDIQGHGTHCAGTVFGQAVEGKARIGVAPDIKRALIGKVLGDNGSGSTAWVAAGIQWAVSEGAHIISMSLGNSFHNSFNHYVQNMGYSLQNALSLSLDNYLSTLKFYNAIVKYNQGANQDAIIIAASGNESGRLIANPFDAPCGLPAVAEGIISVGALGRLGDMFRNISESQASQMTVAPFSNYNNDISAPGYEIYSSLPNNKYASWNGTSMATPHVAGVAALWIEKQLESLGYINPQMLRHQIQGNATMKSVLNRNNRLKIDPSDIGVGLVQSPL